MANVRQNLQSSASDNQKPVTGCAFHKHLFAQSILNEHEQNSWVLKWNPFFKKTKKSIQEIPRNFPHLTKFELIQQQPLFHLGECCNGRNSREYLFFLGSCEFLFFFHPLSSSLKIIHKCAYVMQLSAIDQALSAEASCQLRGHRFSAVVEEGGKFICYFILFLMLLIFANLYPPLPFLSNCKIAVIIDNPLLINWICVFSSEFFTRLNQFLSTLTFRQYLKDSSVVLDMVMLLKISKHPCNWGFEINKLSERKAWLGRVKTFFLRFALSPEKSPVSKMKWN